MFAHVWLRSRNSFRWEQLGSLSFRAGWTHTLPSGLGWGRGHLQTPWSGQELQAWHPDSIIPRNPAPEALLWTPAVMPPCPRPSLKLSVPRVNLNKYIILYWWHTPAVTARVHILIINHNFNVDEGFIYPMFYHKDAAQSSVVLIICMNILIF